MLHMDRKGGWPWQKKASESKISMSDLFASENKAEAEIAQKEHLAQEHAKVAEEAITGWEKAEAESESLKHRLDALLRQKAALEDRVSHLDAALRESTKQLKHTREDQEQRIHETIVQKTRDMATQLADFDTEKSAMESQFQEQAEVIASLKQANAQSEEKIKFLEEHSHNLERENTKWKYEVDVVRSKQIEILRDEERENNKKSIEAAVRECSERANLTIAKLETECQRLRSLVDRKRLPRIKAETRGTTPTEKLNKIRSSRSRRVESSLAPIRNPSNNPNSMPLSVPREKNHPGQFTALQYGLLEYPSQEPSLASTMSEAETGTADDDGISFFEESQEKTVDIHSSELSLMNDFVEMEKLASNIASEMDPKVASSTNADEGNNQTLPKLDEDHQATISRLKQFLDSIFRARDNGLTSLEKVVDEVKMEMEALQIQKSDSPFKSILEVRDFENNESIQAFSPRCNSVDCSLSEEKPMVSPIESKTSSIGRELADAIHKVLVLIEGLCHEDQGLDSPSLTMENGIIMRNLKSPEFDASIQSLVSLCQCLLEEKVDVFEFMVEVTSALEWLVSHLFIAPEKPSNLKIFTKPFRWNKTSLCNESAVLGTTSRHANNKGENKKLTLELKRLGSMLKMERSKNESFKEELCRVEFERSDYKRKYLLAIDEVEDIKKQLQETRQSEAKFHAKLTVAIRDKSFLEKEITNLKISAESQLQHIKYEFKCLEEKNMGLLREFQEERKQHTNLRIQLHQLRQEQKNQLTKGENQSITKEDNSVSPQTLMEDTVRLEKEQEILAAAERLVECQETIFLLEKQLKSLGFSQESLAKDSYSSVNILSDPISSFDKTVITTQSVVQGNGTKEGLKKSTEAWASLASGSSVRPRSDRSRNPSYEINHIEPQSFRKACGLEEEGEQNRIPISNLSRSGSIHGRKQVFLPDNENNNSSSANITLASSPISSSHYSFLSGPIRNIALQQRAKGVTSPSHSPGRLANLGNRGGLGITTTTANTYTNTAPITNPSRDGIVSSSSSCSSEKHGRLFARFFRRTKSGN